MHVSDNYCKKCLSVGYSGILFAIVVRVFAPAYTRLCRGLKYLLKVRYIIVGDPNGAGFFRSFFWAGRQHGPMSEKYRCTASYGMPLNFITFFLWILLKIDEYSSLKCYILTKHS